MTQSQTTSELPKHPLGPTGLMVTPLCVGCAPLGDMEDTFGYSVPEEQAVAMLRTVFDSPINFIDTAASYGDGEAERRLGAVLEGIGRLPEGYVLMTKADRDLQTGDFSGEQIRRSVERSLRLLGLDQLQVVHLHDPEHSTFEEIMAPGGAVEVLLRFKEQGIIGHVGVAGGPIDVMTRYVETGAFDLLITHNRYTLVSQVAAPLLDLGASRGMAVLNAAPYASGILAKGPESGARYAYQEAPPEVVERVRKMSQACARHGVPLAAAALQFSMRDPRITSTIVGMTKPERIQQTVDLANHPIPDDLWSELASLGVSTEDPEANRWT
ncbi:MAG: aldo/keto reductase [Chloroflexota bacterium]|nr:aldo/keto reductase [Chloroflexota bacterium]